MRRFDKGFEIGHIAVHRLHVVVIGDIVAVVLEGGGVKGEQPDGVDAEVFQIIEFFYQPLKVADAVGITIVEGADMHLIDDGVFIPERFIAHR